MINFARSYNFDDYIEILRRRIWYIVIPFLVIIIGTALYLISAPRIYKASTLILVTPQKVPEVYVRPTVTSRIEERLQSISQEVLSRTRLEQVISQYGLYKNESKNLSREAVVELMLKDIILGLPKKNEDRDFFTISYQGTDPNIVATVANRLASLFIEENLKLMEQRAVGTTEFLADELAAKKVKLEELEAVVSQYKRQHMGELPEQRDTNLRILEQYQSQYQRVGENLRAAQDRKLYLQKQLADLELPITGPGAASTSRSPGGLTSSSSPETAGTYESQKDSLTKLLDDLRAKYTESHPDVVMVKKKLADLEKKKDVYDIKKDPRYRALANQLSLTDIEIKRFQNQEPQIASQINIYRGRIENLPSREQEMASQFREYNNTKESYELLLKKSQEAQQSENLERRQKGEQFRIIDPARVPEQPFSPDIPKVLLIGFVISIGCGFGCAIIREQLDRSFHDAGDVEVTLGLRVLATIPTIEQKTA
ncbi:MAG: Wzz/FepE/Etk N-terminal domain-containing protein [Syntrophales bacterium]|jgi:polysaccharide chain length determinant protein (PEP-CTERM system associated)